MHTSHRLLMLAASMSTLVFAGCGGNNDDKAPTQSYVGSGGVALAWADPAHMTYAVAPLGSYAGKRQFQRGTVDPMTGAETGQQAGIEIYKASNGRIYGVDLTSSHAPLARQISTEMAATVDDTCSWSGIAVAGADNAYMGVFFAADLKSPTNSSYAYRLPGADGVCNTPDDLVHMVKTGMSPGDAPIVALAMPSAAVYSDQGAITGFVAKNGADLMLYDATMSHPVLLGSFASPIGSAAPLANGLVQGYASGQLFVVDGQVVYVNYAAHSVSPALYTIPNWAPTEAAIRSEASPTTLYLAVNHPADGPVPASADLLRMPADGSAAPTLVVSQPGRITELQFPVGSSRLIVGSVDTSYSVQAFPESGGAPTSLLASAQNAGRFTATSAAVYYTTWAMATAGNVVTRSGTQSGIVGTDGAVILAPVPNSMFATGGEALPWAAGDLLARQTSYATVFQVTGLTTVQVTEPDTGRILVADGVSGGSLRAIDTATQAVGATLGTLPISTATLLGGTFRHADHIGFLDATNYASTQSPSTHELYLLDARRAGSLVRVTSSL